MQNRILRLLVLTMVLLGFAVATAQEFDWRRFEGSEIRFMMNRHPFTNWLEPLVPEFEAATGITVNLEVLPEDQFRQVRLLEVSSGATTLDGYMMMPGQVSAQYLGAGWMRFIDDLVADPSLTMPDLDLDDFFGGALSTFQSEDGLFGLPLQIESSLLFYRADLFEAAGIDGPPDDDGRADGRRRPPERRRGRRLRHARSRRRGDQPDGQPAVLLRRQVAERRRHVGAGLAGERGRATSSTPSSCASTALRDPPTCIGQR